MFFVFFELIYFPHIIVEQTYKCYHWTDDEKENHNQGGWSVQNEKKTCEEHGFIFSHGNDYKAPGCGTCWCCQPSKNSGNYNCI